MREWIVENENGYLRELNALAWADAVQMAAQIDRKSRATFSRRITKLVNAREIDARYYELLGRLVASSADEVIDVVAVNAT